MPMHKRIRDFGGEAQEAGGGELEGGMGGLGGQGEGGIRGLAWSLQGDRKSVV